MGNLIEGGGSNLPSEFKDPFTHDSVDRVEFSFHKAKSMFRDDKFHSAIVYLINGNSKGSQKFYDDDPDILRTRVQTFINNLSK